MQVFCPRETHLFCLLRVLLMPQDSHLLLRGNAMCCTKCSSPFAQVSVYFLSSFVHTPPLHILSLDVQHLYSSKKIRKSTIMHLSSRYFIYSVGGRQKSFFLCYCMQVSYKAAVRDFITVCGEEQDFMKTQILRTCCISHGKHSMVIIAWESFKYTTVYNS